MADERDMRINFARGLRTLRESSGKTQREVADTVGVSVGTISAWERGKSCPDTPLYLKRLIALFDTDIYTLIGHNPEWNGNGTVE